MAPQPADHPHLFHGATVSDRAQRLSILWGLPAAIIICCVAGMVANLDQWLSFPGTLGNVWFAATICAALLSRYHLPRMALGFLVTAAFAGRAITAMFYANESGFARPVAALCLWAGVWFFAIQAVSRIIYVRQTDHVVPGA